MVTPTAQRGVVKVSVEEHRLPCIRACRAVGFSRSAWYQPTVDWAVRDASVRAVLNAFIAGHARRGFWKYDRRLRTEGDSWNHKRVHRAYSGIKLNLPRRTKRRVPTRERQPLTAPTGINRIWVLDFLRDTLPFRTLNVIDESNREALCIEIGTSIPAAGVVRAMDQILEVYGRPEAVRLENGPELTAGLFVQWAQDQDIAIQLIQPGKPNQNVFVERFNRSFREEVLNADLFNTIREVQHITAPWVADYNRYRPHESRGNLPPTTFLPRPHTPDVATFKMST